MTRMKNANLRNIPVGFQLVQSTSNHIDQDLRLIMYSTSYKMPHFKNTAFQYFVAVLPKKNCVIFHRILLNLHHYLSYVYLAGDILKHKYLRSF